MNPYEREIMPKILKTKTNEKHHARCQHCKEYIVTETESKDGFIAWATCIGCCLVFNIFSCFGFCAFNIDAVKDVDHKCPECHETVAFYKPCL